MYDLLLSHQGALSPRDLARYAGDLGLDVERFRDELRTREYAQRVSEDVGSADESGVSGTPTFFINGRRHYGVYDIDTLTEEVEAAKRRALQLAAGMPPLEEARPDRSRTIVCDDYRAILTDMELGLATFADLSSGVTPEQRMRDLLEEAELADQLGLDVFAIGEHHRSDFLVSAPAIPSPPSPRVPSTSASQAR